MSAAMRLFRDQGYEPTSIKQICERAGVNAGSVYYFFRQKEDILLAVLDRYRELLWPAIFEPTWRTVPDPLERLFAVLAGYRELLARTACRDGCPIGNLALEVGQASEAIRTRIAANFEDWRRGIRSCLEDAGSRLPADVDRDALATLVLTVMEGGIMQARIQHSFAPFDAGVAMLRDYFRRLTAARDGGDRDSGPAVDAGGPGDALFRKNPESRETG